MIKKWIEAGNANWETLCQELKIVGDDMKLVNKLLVKYCGETESDDSSDPDSTSSEHSVHELSSGVSVLKKVCTAYFY